MSRPEWFPDWFGHDCIIVASGPSALDQPIYMAKGRFRAIAVNHSWRIAPWADALYASDAAWWGAGFGNAFTGIKVSRSAVDGVRKVDLVEKGDGWDDRMVFDRMGSLGSGGSSGFQSLNLAVQFGSRRIALVGFDARVDLGRHWHGDHTDGLANPTEGTAAMWADRLDTAAPSLAAAGVEVTNCSPTSALTAYPKASLSRWLEGRNG